MISLFYRYIGTISYIVGVTLINVAFTRLPFFHVLGSECSPGDILVGSIYIIRDFAQREIGHKVIIAMAIAGAISYALADPSVAKASISAFIVGETIDWAIFSFTGKPLSERLILSSVISSPIDSFVFLYMIGRPYWLEFTIMTLGKIVGVMVVWYGWRRRQLKTNNETAQPLQA